MGAKVHTIIVVPHSRAKYRKLRISNGQIATVLFLFLALTGSALFVGWRHFTRTVELDELATLRAENQELRALGNELETRFRTLRGQLDEFEEQTNDLAIVAGLADVVSVEAGPARSGSGAGGDFERPSDTVVDPERLEQRSQRLSDRLAKLDVTLQEQEQWVASQPSIRPVAGIFTSYFGRRTDPITGRPAQHNGLDISAPRGNPVLASADGVVVAAGSNGNLGRAVKISHGYGLTTLYGHLESLEVQAGDRIQRGDRVGTVGNTGRSTGYHLHYEVRVKNRAKNPLEFILE